MRSILEKAIVHLLNGEQEKAEALFHRFMVEKARRIHESLRQDEDADLGDGWDNETHEEEYLGDDDLADDDKSEEVGDDVDGAGDVDTGDVDADADEDGDVVDDMGDDEDMNLGNPDEEEGEEEEIGDKLDDLEDKISELTAEFDRLMSKFDDDMNMGHSDEEEDDLEDVEGDLDDAEGDVEDAEDELEGAKDIEDAEDDGDLSDRMDDDMGPDDSEEGVEPEEKAMESMDYEDLDEALDDITESVLSELDKIAPPGNTDGKEVGTGKTIAGNHRSSLPNHGVEDRVKGAKPFMVKGGNNDSFAREPAPAVKDVDSVVKGVKNSRKSFSDKMERKSKEGDASAALNHDFASRPATQSPVDGKKSKK